jgi:putative N6-adenine-specific DNA methylase
MDLQQSGTFFIQVTPGFEQLAWLELLKKVPTITAKNSPTISEYSGGFELELSLSLGFHLPSIVKLPNRILLRLEQFKCRDLPKLFNKVKKQDWRFFNANQLYTFHVSSSESRLFDSRKIEKTLSDALKTSYEAYPPKKKQIEKINSCEQWHLFCRFENDTCTISLDLSGERLSKRGYKKASGLAPLRENLAAGLWFFATHDDESPKSLLDPFAGSGTILCEAALFDRPNNFRHYNAQIYLENVVSCQSSDALELHGFERDEQQHSCLIKNLKACKLSAHILRQENTQAFKELSHPVDLILTNPPFDKRLKENRDFWQLENIAKKIGVLTPEDRLLEIPNYQVRKQLKFKHGGMKVVFTLFTRS